MHALVDVFVYVFMMCVCMYVRTHARACVRRYVCTLLMYGHMYACKSIQECT